MIRKEHIVYLDCDGVFADFVTGMLKALNIPYGGTKEWPFGQCFDFFPQIDITWEKAGTYCDHSFWANLSWMEDGKEILAQIWKRFRPTETMLLTKPMGNDGSYSGKAQWVEQHIPELHHRIIPTHIEKFEFAFDFNCLLIDDNEKNCEDFYRSGGAAILVPRPWNKLDFIFYDGGTVESVADGIDKWIKLTKHPAQNRKEQHV